VIWNIYNQPKLTSLPSSVTAEYWVLVLSAASLVVGLATYGKRVTRVIGKELAKVRRVRAYKALVLQPTRHPPAAPALSTDFAL